MLRFSTRDRALQNRAFLKALRRTGNTSDASRQAGPDRSTFEHRRRVSPAFATEWDAALAVAHAHLHDCAGRAAADPNRDTVAEPSIIRKADGRLQLRRPRPGRLTRADEQAFLTALSATANIRLSAAAAGFTHGTFYHRRKTSPAFAREMRLALQTGYDRLELALLESVDPASHADDAWRHNDPPAMPPMTAAQALHLLYIHQKEARLLAEPAHIKRRRGESREAHSYRLGAMYEARVERDREAFRMAEAERQAAGTPSPFGPPDDIAPLPDLSQVTGWSKADPTKPDGLDALFGEWRAGDWEGR